jgi:hypothetical protein
MSKYLGDFSASAVIDFKFTTFRPSTGAPFTLAGTPVVSVYKDNDTTQSTTGVVLTVDFDSVTGLNHVRVTTTDAFYANGSEFECVITAGTVDSVSVVGSCVGRFTLRSQASLYPTTAGNTLDVNANGEAGIDWANVGNPTTTLALTNTTIANVTVGSISANAITAASIAADAIDADALATDAVTEIVTAVWTRDPQVGFASGTSGYWLYEAGVNSQAIVSDTNTIAGTLYVESIADALLNRNVGGGSNSGRLVKEALYALRNKSEIVGTTLSVYDAGDDLSWTATVASSASADPVTGIDP